ncbi:thioesterase family protein [Blastomonas sp.]|uniref:acyl-CoA thioesterase n=1 Tax=Blastomonas sp. TaxID=1909299 RepID=UPI00260E6EEE|nr:thioesterase family protein [Blastomonas sp.]MDM7958089.1 thioesterase family protein [Blastomonas sp.]
MSRPERPVRADYAAFTAISTRWSDNDIYGHVNNSVYYFWFDTAVNEYLIRAGALDIHGGDTIGLVVDTGCAYFAPAAFPDTIHAGIRVDHIGTSSVRYGVGLFRNDDQDAAAAGHFTHVYVNRASRRPVSLPDSLRTALDAIRC